MKTFLNDLTYGVSRQDFALRTATVFVVGLIAAWIVNRHWSWFVKDLEEDGIRPGYVSPTTNAVLWFVWYVTLGSLWGFHLRNHPNRVKVDGLYPLLLLLTISWQVALFEKRSTTASKWIALSSLFVLLYIMYDSYGSGTWWVGLSLMLHTLLVAWTTLQLWHIDNRNCNKRKCSRGGGSSSYSHPWSDSNSSWGYNHRPIL